MKPSVAMTNPLRKKAEELAVKIQNSFVYATIEAKSYLLEAALLSVREETIEECARICESACDRFHEPIADKMHVEVCIPNKLRKRIRALAAQKEGQKK